MPRRRRLALRRHRQRRYPRSARRAALGPRQHRSLRRRSSQRHRIRRISGCIVGDPADGDARLLRDCSTERSLKAPPPALDLAEPEVAVGHAEQLLRALDLSLADSEQLRDLPAEAIRTAQLTVRGRPGDWLGFFPVLDPETAAGATAERIRRRRWRGHSTRHRPQPRRMESVRSADAGRSRAPDRPSGSAARGRLSGPKRRTDCRTLLETYRKSREQKALFHHDAALMRAILGDMRFRLAERAHRRVARARGLPTYAYFFSYPSPALGGALGACHALELPFVFGNLDAPQQERFAGKVPRCERSRPR